jgi:Amt family ammonium transporter
MWAQKKTGEIKFDVSYALNGCLSGLVGVTAGCALIEPWAALVIGSVSGILYLLASKLLIRLRIDDAVDAIPVHLCNGIWGVIAVGLFASPRRMEAIYHRSDHVGWFYSWGRGSADATLLGTNLVGLLFIIGFVILVMVPFFFMMLYLGWFRSDPLEEIVGLDLRYRGSADHGGALHHGITNGSHLHLATLKEQLRARHQFESDVRDDDLNMVDDLDMVEETVTTTAT